MWIFKSMFASRSAPRGRRALAVWVALAALVTIIFAATPLDIAASRIFYRADPADHWPLARVLPWSVLYDLAPWITASLVIMGLAMLAAGTLRRRQAWRRHSVFLLLSVVLGPGLVVNAIFKDHWDRPRPRDLVEFSGPLHYQPAPLPGGEGGKSFPCGHCSVGFLYASGWWVWRRSRPARARASLAIGLAVGSVLGLGRMADGGHFLSDVIWSALLVLGIAHVLYYYVLRVPAQDALGSAESATHPHSPRWHRIATVLAALGGTAVLLALFVTPHGAQLTRHIPLASLPRAPQVLVISARTANVEIVVIDLPATQVSIEGELHGFGLPGSRLDTQIEFLASPIPTLSYRIEQHGWFTDLDGFVRVRIPADQLKLIVVHLEHGNIRITDATRAGVVRTEAVRLDLATAAGHIQSPVRN